MRNITFILMILFISVSWAAHLEFPEVPPQVSFKAVTEWTVIQSKLHAVKVEMMTEAGHFDWVHPGSPAFQKLLDILKP